MTKAQLKNGLAELQKLSSDDYHQSLEEVLSDRDKRVVLLRLGRLIGVSLKEPFATPVPTPGNSPSRSGSYRAWELQHDRFRRREVRKTWQYRTLETIRRAAPDGQRFATVKQLAMHAHHERGFFTYLARSAHGYICGNRKIRQEIDKRVKAAKKAGFTTKHLTPEVLVQAGGLALGTYLVATVPPLVHVGAPVIAGVVLVLYSIGSDAFCRYVDDRFEDAEQ